jgi:5-hydroxyisourate hydrolase/2-oxo-4-hydroxy-4-carboxy-5-ureidoimidazoline decarboxylase
MFAIKLLICHDLPPLSTVELLVSSALNLKCFSCAPVTLYPGAVLSHCKMAIVVPVEVAIAACASKRFTSLLSTSSPYPDVEQVIAAAQRIWWNEVDVTGWLEAFAAHPKIGDNKAVEQKPEAFKAFSRQEQAAAAQSATLEVMDELLEWNKRYLEKFGHIFIICARGKTSQEILSVLKGRFHRRPHEELVQAATEQMSITELRLRASLASASSTSSLDSLTLQKSARRADQVLSQLVPSVAAGGPLRSPITTHALDTALGCPAHGLPLFLSKRNENSGQFEKLAEGVTNEDGRVGNLLPPANVIASGHYKMTFNTQAYLLKCRTIHPSCFHPVPFYPEVNIEFEISPDKSSDHYHIPLLISPYCYSTYKGS